MLKYTPGKTPQPEPRSDKPEPPTIDIEAVIVPPELQKALAKVANGNPPDPTPMQAAETVKGPSPEVTVGESGTMSDAIQFADESASEDDPPQFPIDVLPETLRHFVGECARVNSVPVELPAACVLAIVSASCGSRLRVKTIHGKVAPANIYVLGAAQSGSGKSEVFSLCFGPVKRWSQREAQRWEAEVLPRAKAEARLLAKAIKALENSSDADERALSEIAAKEARLAIVQAQLLPPTYHASDYTNAELVRILARMDGQLFSASPDAKNVVDMMLGRHNEGKTDEEVYLKAFSLDPIDRHRVGDGAHSVPEPCIEGLWLTQPDKLERLLAERTVHESGLLPRILPFTVNCPPLRVSIETTGVDDSTSEQYEALITSLLRAFRMRPDGQVIDADRDARQALIDYHNETAKRREVELGDVTSFAARWGEYAWRLALVIHAARLGVDAAQYPLSFKDAQAGIALMRWFGNQQLEILQKGRTAKRKEQRAAALKLFSLLGKAEIVASDLYRNGVTPRNDPEAARALLDEMEASGLLICSLRPTGRKNHTAWFCRRKKAA